MPTRPSARRRRADGKDGKEGKSKKKKGPIHEKGSDADGDGKKNESKKRDRNDDGDDGDSWDDAVRSAQPTGGGADHPHGAPPQDGDGKPNKVDKDKQSKADKKYAVACPGSAPVALTGRGRAPRSLRPLPLRFQPVGL